MRRHLSILAIVAGLVVAESTVAQTPQISVKEDAFEIYETAESASYVVKGAQIAESTIVYKVHLNEVDVTSQVLVTSSNVVVEDVDGDGLTDSYGALVTVQFSTVALAAGLLELEAEVLGHDGQIYADVESTRVSKHLQLDANEPELEASSVPTELTADLTIEGLPSGTTYSTAVFVNSTDVSATASVEDVKVGEIGGGYGEELTVMRQIRIQRSSLPTLSAGDTIELRLHSTSPLPGVSFIDASASWEIVTNSTATPPDISAKLNDFVTDLRIRKTSGGGLEFGDPAPPPPGEEAGPERFSREGKAEARDRTVLRRNAIRGCYVDGAMQNIRRCESVSVPTEGGGTTMVQFCINLHKDNDSGKPERANESNDQDCSIVVVGGYGASGGDARARATGEGSVAIAVGGESYGDLPRGRPGGGSEVQLPNGGEGIAAGGDGTADPTANAASSGSAGGDASVSAGDSVRVGALGGNGRTNPNRPKQKPRDGGDAEVKHPDIPGSSRTNRQPGGQSNMASDLSTTGGCEALQDPGGGQPHKRSGGPGSAIPGS